MEINLSGHPRFSLQLLNRRKKDVLQGVNSWKNYDLSQAHVAYLQSPLKRTMDVAGALIGILTGFPLFAVAALITLLIDRVPAIFYQERLGLGGRPFIIMKLRTLAIIETRATVLVANMQQKPSYRTTPTGQFWRTTSIDEIIQFWLVLKGQMSLVGYRPIPIYYVSHLHEMEGLDSEKVEHYLNIVSQFKPGMTSLSSVNGRANLTMQQKMEYDMMYAQRADFLADLKILIKTIVAVITCNGAK